MGFHIFLRSEIRLMCGMAYVSVGNGYFFGRGSVPAGLINKVRLLDVKVG